MGVIKEQGPVRLVEGIQVQIVATQLNLQLFVKGGSNKLLALNLEIFYIYLLSKTFLNCQLINCQLINCQLINCQLIRELLTIVGTFNDDGKIFFFCNKRKTSRKLLIKK